jgi:hypothetical protein
MKQNLNPVPLEKTKDQTYFVGMSKTIVLLAWMLVIGTVASSFAQRARTTTSTNMVTTTTNTTTKVISPP